MNIFLVVLIVGILTLCVGVALLAYAMCISAREADEEHMRALEEMLAEEEKHHG
jgi:uncharacterized membrane protein HdeD (DUF308 family)